MMGIVSTTESERRSGSGESHGRGDCRERGEEESRFERLRQLTHGNALCHTTKRLKGRHPLNGPWCNKLRAVVPNKNAVRKVRRPIENGRARPLGAPHSKRGQVNVVHVSSFQENRKFSRIKAGYGERVACNHVAYSLSLF